MTRTLRLPRALVDAMIADARERAPNEAVGMLGGNDQRAIVKCIRLPNSEAGPAYWADPFAQWQALRTFKGEGLVPVAVYHSHPEGGATLSAADRAFAARVNMPQIVIALNEGRARLAAYDVGASGSVTNLPIVIE
jgi:[CysO sulfur-carrier protein]-S-L-cysteine hydrolase